MWTIGHSTRSLEEFFTLLKAHKIQLLVDVRSFPGSRKYPHFNREVLSDALSREKIDYVHMAELGGRRKPKKDSRNTNWRNDAFRGYADHMETPEFRQGIQQLMKMGAERRTAFMCSEAVWWRCHRSLIADTLKSKGTEVIHIMDKNKSQEHPYTSAARVDAGKLYYGPSELF